MWRHDQQWLVRPQCEQVLSGPAQVVAVVGPEGAGKTALLSGWARGRDDAHWFDAGPFEPAAGTVVLVDDADALEADAWKLLGEAVAAVPRLRVRLALRSVTALPGDWSAETLSPYFSEDEVALVLAGFESPADPRAVYALTGGHPASVVELARSGAATPAKLAEALARNTTAALPAALADLAVPDHLSRRVAEALGYDPGVLDEVERAGWGGWARGTGPALFALTPRLRAATRRRFPPTSARRRELRLRAAEVLLADGAHFPALVEALQADRPDLADAALKQGGLPILTTHGYELLLLLSPLPVFKLGRHPALAMALALVYNARERNRLKAIEMVGVALAGARMAGRSSPDRALMRVVESVGLRITGAGDGGLRAARSAARMLQELPVEARVRLGTLEPDLHVHLAISLLYGGAASEAAEAFDRAWGVHARAAVQLQALGGGALVRVLEGRLTEARSRIADAEARAWPPELLDGYAGSLLRIAQALEAVERFDFETAGERIDAVWSHVGTIEHWPLLIHVRALVDLGREDLDAGLERFRQMRERRSGRRGATAMTQRRLDVTENLLLTAIGDLAAATSLRPSSGDRPDVVLAAARVALLTGDHARALALLGRCEVHTPVDRLGRATLEAMLARRLGQAETAETAARRAVAIVSSHGVRLPLLLVPGEDRELFRAVGPPHPPVVLRHPLPVTIPLTPRERVVLRELVTESNVEDIARRLHVSVNTVKSQRRSLYRKLGAASREEAVATAAAHGLLDT